MPKRGVQIRQLVIERDDWRVTVKGLTMTNDSYDETSRTPEEANLVGLTSRMVIIALCKTLLLLTLALALALAALCFCTNKCTTKQWNHVVRALELLQNKHENGPNARGPTRLNNALACKHLVLT